MRLTATIICMVICAIVLMTAGIIEKQRHNRSVSRIPLRINVNGIRGKSTITRMITSILQNEGIYTIGKTTGSSARMLYWFEDEEYPIERSPEGSNIKEQIGVIRAAANLGAEALVCECMAVNPALQKVYQFDMIKAQLVVIVNVLPDHLDQMGPTLFELAMAFADTIPYNGKVVVNDSEFTEYFGKVAKERGSRMYVADESEIPDGFLDKFNYAVFPNNVAVTLAVAKALGISRERALEGILKAQPDPGAMTITPVGRPGRNAYFINGFAANDPSSTLSIWDYVREKGYLSDNVIILANCRPDRVDRTKQMAKDVIPNISAKTIIAAGNPTKPIKNARDKGMYGDTEFLDMNGQSAEAVVAKIGERLDNALIFGIGNIHGIGEELIEGILALDGAQIINDTEAEGIAL